MVHDAAKLYRQIPRRNTRFAPVLICAVGLALCSCLFATFYFVLHSANYRPHQSFLGEIRPAQNPLILTLPRGAVLRDVQVKRNEHLRRGQTIASLDVETMQNHTRRVQAQLIQDTALRDCLLYENAAFESPLPELEKDFKQALEFAQQTCLDVLAERTTIEEGFNARSADLRTKRTLVSRYTSLLAENTQARDHSAEKVQETGRALKLAILRSELDQEVTSLEIERDAKFRAWNDARLKRVEQLAKDIDSNAALRKEIAQLILQPRLTAPADGFIVQVRHPPLGQATTQDIELLVMRPENASGYEARFHVLKQDIEKVQLGQPVTLELLGFGPEQRRLKGEVSQFSGQSEQTVTARILLEQSSIAYLDDPKIGIALRGMSTASLIKVRKLEMTFSQVFTDTIQSSIVDLSRNPLLKLVTRSRAWDLTPVSNRPAQ